MKQRLWIHYLSKFVCVLALAYFVRQSYQEYHSAKNDFRLLLLLIADSYTIFLVLRARYSDQVNRRPVMLLVASVSSCYFIFLQLNTGVVLIPYRYGQWIQILGIGLQLMAKVYLGKSFGILPANRGLVTRGPYNWIRHPMYLGYFINHLGFLACTFSYHNLILYGALYLMIAFRLLEEERLLSRDPAYPAYAARVRWRFLPGLF